MGTLPVALQVYSIREEAEQDFTKAMKNVKAMGYDGVELAGLYGLEPEKIKATLMEIGLKPISAHVAYDLFGKDLVDTIKSYATIGCRYLAIPYLDEDFRYGTEKFNQFVNDIPRIAQECRKAGITLLYHNHDFEFAGTEDGEYILDYLYRNVSPEDLQVELDTCWAKFSGVDPAEYIRSYKGRCPVVHLKDYNGVEPFEFRAVGFGVQDFPSIIKAAEESGSKWLIVEQDRHIDHSAMEDAVLSRDYLKKLGY